MQNTKVKIDVEKFDGKGDFGMWKFKMLMQLENADLDSVITEEDTSSKSEKDKDAETETKPGVSPEGLTRKEMDKRAKNMICASLSNLVLRKVMKQTTALGVWRALEKDYQTKTLPNRIYLKQRFASFRMEEQRSVEENLDVS